MNRVCVVARRLYRTKGAKNRSSTASGTGSGGAKGTNSKSSVKVSYLEPEEVPTTANIEKDPSSFTTIHTDYGWAAIPKKCYSFRWTKEQIDALIQSGSSPSQTKLQKLICEWSRGVNLSEIPKTVKPTAKELAQIKEDALYRSQLKYDIYDIEGNRNNVHNKRPFLEKKVEGNKTVVKGTVNFTHAWNYYYSVTYPQFSHLPQGQGTKKVSAQWNEMKMDEKEVYRQKYADLLKSGMDIYKGKVITIEEKMKINQTFNKYKETQRAKMVAREENIARLFAEEEKSQAAKETK